MSETDPSVAIGKIVKSNSHIDYVCQVFGRGEIEPLPAAGDYAFGNFVAIRADEGGDGGRLIGVIYNTLLLNPDFGSMGPRLSPRSDVEVFMPDYLAETATLLGIIAVGRIDASGRVSQGVPAFTATVNAPVARLEPTEVAHFHRAADGRVCLHYASLLLSQSNPLALPLLLAIIDQVGGLFPDDRDRLTVMRNNLAWRHIVQPSG